MSIDVEELERRVTALETAQNETTQTLRWVVSKLGRISAVQDEHTLRLERIESRIDEVDGRLEKVEADVKGLREDMPSIVADALREAMRDQS